MEKIVKDIEKILKYNGSFSGEVESLGKLGFYETNLVSGTFKASANFRKLCNLPERDTYEVAEYQELIHPDDIARVLEEYNTCLKERRNFESDYRVIVKEEVRYFRGKSVFIRNKDGVPVKVVGVRQDVTEEKLAEIDRREYRGKLEQAQEAAATLAHDLKAPIHNISMIAELLKGNVAEGKTQMIEMLEESCRRSYEIIDDVLDGSLAEEDNCNASKECCNVQKLVQKAVSTLYYTAEKKKVKILTSLQPDLYAFVYSRRLQRAIENLLSNAVKFSQRDSNIEVSLHGKKQWFVIKIKDFGLGMSEWQVESLFHENCYRREGTGGEKSSGLGMNIVKKIISQHQGTVCLKSKEGKGTTFYMELPRQ